MGLNGCRGRQVRGSMGVVVDRCGAQWVQRQTGVGLNGCRGRQVWGSMGVEVDRCGARWV